MRKTALILIMLTLWVLSANVLAQESEGRGDGQVIDAIVNETQIVISDEVYQIAPHAAFYNSDGRTLVDFRSFKEGDFVDITVNSRNVIVEITKSTGQ